MTPSLKLLDPFQTDIDVERQRGFVYEGSTGPLGYLSRREDDVALLSLAVVLSLLVQ